MFIRRAVLALLLVAGASIGCKSKDATSHVSLSTVDPLRTAFNADSGKVRAIFLASPT
jgi:hypothetical protein